MPVVLALRYLSLETIYKENGFFKIHERSFVCFQCSYVSMATPRSVEFRNEIHVYSAFAWLGLASEVY